MPGLTKKRINIPVVGMAAGGDPKLAPSRPIMLQNAVELREGEIRKRYGLIGLDTNYTSEPALTSYKGSPYLLGQALRSWDSGGEVFRSVQPLGFMDVDLDPLPSRNGVINYGGEVAENDSHRAIVLFVTSGGSFQWDVKIYERATGILTDEGTYSYQARPITIGATIYIFVPDGVGTQTIKYAAVDGAGEIGSLTAIAGAQTTHTSLVGYREFDVACLGGTSAMVLHKTALGDAGVLATADIVGGVWNNTLIARTTLGAVSVSKFATSQGLLVYSDVGTSPAVVLAAVYNTSCGIESSAATIYSWATADTIQSVCAANYAANSSWVYVTMSGGSVENSDELVVNSFTKSGAAGSSGTASTFYYGYRVAAKPMVDDADQSRHYLLLQRSTYSDTDARAGYLVIEVTEAGVCLARFWTGRAYTIFDAFLTSPISSGTNAWKMVVVKKTGDYTESTEASVAHLMELTRETPDGLQVLETAHHLEIGNGCPWTFDGQDAYEHGFHSWPRIDSATASAGGSLEAEAAYGYVAIYEFIDARGQRYRSAPSDVVQVDTTAVNQTVTVVVGSLPIMGMGKYYTQIILYRTEGNGTIYYRVAAKDNDPFNRTVSFVDAVADSSLRAEYLYTTGNVLANMAPPPWRVGTVHQERYFVVPRDQEDNTIQYSKGFVEGEAPAFAGEFLQIVVPPRGGRILALASLLDRLIIFKEFSIYAVSGQGLSINGQGRGYSTPDLLSEGVGCRNQRTLVQVPQGLLFEGPDGIYILDRTFNVKLISHDVDEYYRELTIVAGALVPEMHYAIFASDDLALVYDYKYGRWGTFTGYESTTDLRQIGGVIWRQTSSGMVTYEDRTGHQDISDDAAVVSMSIRLGWISLHAIMGMIRVYRIYLIGQSIDDHTLRVKIAYNYDPVWVDNITRVMSAGHYDTEEHFGAGLAAGYADGAYLIDVRPSRQKARAIMIEISDENPTYPGTVNEGFALSAIELLYGVRPGRADLDDNRRA